MEPKELELFGNHVARTLVGVNGEEYVVSTIELNSEVKAIDSLLGGFDDFLDRPGKLAAPGNFETMVFNCDSEGNVSDWMELDFARYANKEEALRGHKDMVSKWISKVDSFA